MKLDLKYKLTIFISLLLLSCQRNELVPAEVITDAITFSLNSNTGYSASTRAAEESFVLISDDGADSLLIQLSDVSYIQDTPITKGTPVTNNNLKSFGGEIALRAFYENEQFVNDVFVFDRNGNVRTSIACYWPVAEDAMVNFWSFHPKEIADAKDYNITNDASTPSLSFYYNQKKADEDILVDATEQKDMFMAYTRQGKESGSVDLEYIHALSSIKFQVVKALSGEVQNITISNVHAGGTITYSPNGSDKFMWDLDDEKYSLNQNFAQNIEEDFAGDLSQGITKDIDNTVFMLIPQPLAGKTLTIKYIKDGESQPKTYTADIPGEKWEPGKSYTYTVSLMDGFGVDIEASAQPSNTSVIDGIKINNIYNKTCYIRAKIIGNWVDEDGNVAAILDPDEVNLKIPEGNSNYQLSTDWGNYWYYDPNTDIYYYRKPLKKSESTTFLFEKFTNPIQHSEGLKLDFGVFVQAVEAESDKATVTSAWGETIANSLEAVAVNAE